MDNYLKLLRGTFFLPLFFFGCSGSGAKKGAESEAVLVSAAPASHRGPSPLDPKNMPQIEIRELKDFEFLMGGAVKFQIVISNYPMAEGWQFAQVLLNRRAVAKMTEKVRNFEISEGLEEGLNQLTVYLARANAESVKAPLAVNSLQFYYRKKTASSSEKSEPGIFISSPHPESRLKEQSIALFDFVVTNAQGRKLKVYYTLDGATREVMSDAAPFEFVNLAKGGHVLKVQLVDSRGKRLGGPFSKDEIRFVVE